MQEIHSIGGSRFFGGSGGGGDRRLRQHHHQNQQALKCPRCDSLNTKFCYYNNYNLSQPRHFCKSCRRYWTKGGVLRNVPVGGGCRKSKRSNKPKNSSSETAATQAPQAPPSQPVEKERKSNSHSSSESSSLTAATAATTTEAVSAPSSNNLLDVQESKLFMNQIGNPSFETAGVLEQGGDCGGIFSEIGTFSSLINSPNESLPAFGFGNMSDASLFRFSALQGNAQWQQQQKVISSMSDHRELKLSEMTGGSMLDQTVPVDFSSLQNKASSATTGVFGPLDWQGSADQGLFDLPNTVDHAYWSQTHWTDQDNNHSLYLP